MNPDKSIRTNRDAKRAAAIRDSTRAKATDETKPLLIANAKAKHTPGPWRLCNPPSRGYAATVGADTQPDPIADVCDFNRFDRDAECAANAALIAAAPELLAVLRKLEWSRIRDGERFCPVCGQRDENPHTPACSLGAAIAKATGAKP